MVLFPGFFSIEQVRMKNNENKKLTDAEEEFCNLFVFGGSKFAGQDQKCYKEVFGSNVKSIPIESRRLLCKPQILAHIKDLANQLQQETEALATKLQITETLKSVMEETASSKYTDKFGVDLSPAPLRAVSINAAKALMDIYPIKHMQESKLRIEGDNGIIFNVIVPSSDEKQHEDKHQS